MNSWSVQRKLMTGFASLATGGVMLSATGITGLFALDRAVDHLTQDSLPALAAAADLKLAGVQLRASMAEVIATDDPSVRELARKHVEAAKALGADAAARHGAIVADGERHELVASSAAMLSTLGDLADQITMDLEAGEVENARLVVAETSPVYEGVVADVTRLIEADRAIVEARVGWAEWVFRGALAALAFGTLLVLAAAVIGTEMVRRTILLPFARTTAAMSSLARGELDVDIEGADRADEIGAMARALAVFERQGRELRAMAGRLEESVGGIVRAVTAAGSELDATAAAMTGDAEATVRRSAETSAGAAAALDGVRQVAAASTELNASIDEIDRQTTRSREVAATAVDRVGATRRTIDALDAAAAEIGDVVRLISEIAGQTNLLALNATIEAARAGDAGRGFAVVASEVKNLAAQTARATDEIGSKIAAIQAATRRSVEESEVVARTIVEIQAIATGVAAAVREQAAATAEISRTIEDVARGTDEVRKRTEQVRDIAERTRSGAEAVHAASAELSRQGENLRAELGRFVEGLRAG